MQCPQNVGCLQTYSLICKELGPGVSEIIGRKYEFVSQSVSQVIMNSKKEDVDLIAEYASVVHKTAEVNLETVLLS